MDADALRQQLAEARAQLIAALQGASETDFNAELKPGMTVVSALADLARRERAGVEEARRIGGLEPRPAPAIHGEPARRLTPPPVVHDLAGAHHEALLLVDALAAQAAPADGIEPAARSLLAIVKEERALAGRIALRIAHKPGSPPAA